MADPKAPERPTGPDPGGKKMAEWMDDYTDWSIDKSLRRLLRKKGEDPDKILRKPPKV